MEIKGLQFYPILSINPDQNRISSFYPERALPPHQRMQFMVAGPHWYNISFARVYKMARGEEGPCKIRTDM